MPQQSSLLELTATFREERFRFANADGDMIVAIAHANGEINGPVTIKGQADLDELGQGETYRFYGQWKPYKNNRTGQVEQQFNFLSFVKQQPAGRQGIIAYLRNAGEGHGLGAVRATKLWEIFGSDAVRMMREQPNDVAAELSRVGLRMSEKDAAKIAEILTQDVAMEGCSLDLIELLHGRGFPKTTSRLVIREWGNRASLIIRRDPYKLMRFRGIGFKKTDAMYLNLGLPPGRLKRQALCAWYAVAKDTEGHTYFPIEYAAQGIKGNISGTDLRIEPALRLARVAGATAELYSDGTTGPITDATDRPGVRRWVGEGKKARHEADLAQYVCNAMVEPAAWQNVTTLAELSPHQQEQLTLALGGPIAILGGSPGTGKTYSAAILIRELIKVFGESQIGIAAPTGKAAVRLSEAMNGYGITKRARTWHSLLWNIETKEWFNERHPLPYKVLIGDETSMNDCDLMAAIFRARAKGTLVLLIGDVNQLPPVGHGAPLRDLIAAGLPYGELKEIKRASGGIVEACAAIRDGQRWEPGDNLQLFDHGEPQYQIKRMTQLLGAMKEKGFDPVWDCQILTAVNKKSALSRQELNKLLQAELNNQPGVEGVVFRVGDKAVNTKNGYFPAVDFDESDPDAATNERGEVYVANGELAEIVSVQEKLMVAKLSSPNRVIKIPMGKAGVSKGDGEDAGDLAGEEDKTGTGCSWDLGYCLSTHKSQGSEWPVVIVMLDEYPGAKNVCDRSWIYTSISRAKKHCVLIGRKSTADRFCRVNRIMHRKTFLKERILQEQAKRELAEL